MIVTGIGQCSLDYLAFVDAYPSVDTKKEILHWQEEGGGPVATALVALSRLGVRCRFFGVVGDDDAGEKIRRSLKEEGLDISGLRTRRDSASQIAFIAVEKGTGRRTIFWRRPTGQTLSRNELGDDLLEGSGMLLLDGLMEDVSICAAGEARRKGLPVMLDAGRVRPGMKELAGLSDFVVGSEEFARELGWELSPGALAEERIKLGAKALTITLGERGSVTASCEGDCFEMPAFKVDIVDTTGAGDVFHGGYAYGILQGWEIRRTVAFASALAALKCTRAGGRAGIAGLDDVLNFMDR